MRLTLEPDKVVFIDELADEHPEPVHSIELSDERSDAHFITFYVKGLDASAAFINAIGQQNESGSPTTKQLQELNTHNPPLFHRESPSQWWLKENLPKRKGWHMHYHVRLDHPPGLEDLERFGSSVPAILLKEIRR